MTSAAAAGNGRRSHGLFRGLAPAADVVLVQVAGPDGRIGNAAIARALDWLRWEGPDLGLRVVNLSLGGDAVSPLAGNPVDQAVASLVERGLITEAGRESGPGGAVRYRTTPLFERIFGLESLAALPRLDDLGADVETIRERLHAVAEARAS